MPILAELRTRTRPHHDRLESCVDLERRCGTRAGYVGLLRCFYGFYAPAEAQIARCDGAERFDAARRRKTALFARDLETLLGPGILETIPLCDFLPPLGALPEVAGCLYVLEGATLGGQIIARHLKQALALDAQNGASFFHSYGDNIGPLWKSFGLALEDYALDAPTQDAVIRSAAATFDALERWLGAAATLPEM